MGLLIIVIIIGFWLIKKRNKSNYIENNEDMQNCRCVPQAILLKQEYPLFIDIYKGEGRILIIPNIRHIGGFSVNSHNTFSINIFSDSQTIGQSVFNALEYIKNSPPDTSTPYDRQTHPVWKENTKYKSKISFYKNNHHATVEIYENGNYDVYSLYRYDDGYGDIAKKIALPSNATADDIGQAIIEVLENVEQYNNVTVKETYQTIQLLDNSTITFTIPDDVHFVDSEDSGACEIYQCYSYIPKNGDESIAEFYLGIASELDCNLSPENICNCLVELNGKADRLKVENVEYGIFRVRAEMRNKSVHKISYFLQMTDDLLLECGMEVHQPNKRKNTDEKLSNLFEQFALSCKKTVSP